MAADVRVRGGRTSAATLDSLATFETSREDLEDGGDHEPSVGGGFGGYAVDAELDDSDDEPDHDNEYDYLNAPHVLRPEVAS